MKRLLPALLWLLAASPAGAQALGVFKSATGLITVAAPVAPASTAAFAMQGLSNGAALITPVNTGNVLIVISGTVVAGTTANDGITFQLAYGTGLGPANAAAATGTVVGLPQTESNAGTTALSVPFSLSAVVTGLITNRNYWFDLQAKSITTVSHAALANVTVTAVELR